MKRSDLLAAFAGFFLGTLTVIVMVIIAYFVVAVSPYN